jgi:hypothetical protein
MAVRARDNGLAKVRATFPDWNIFRSTPSADAPAGYYASRSYVPGCDTAAGELRATVTADDPAGLAAGIAQQVAEETRLARTALGGAR